MGLARELEELGIDDSDELTLIQYPNQKSKPYFHNYYSHSRYLVGMYSNIEKCLTSISFSSNSLYELKVWLDSCGLKVKKPEFYRDIVVTKFDVENDRVPNEVGKIFAVVWKVVKK